MKNTIIGILFAMLWASASVATKFGIRSADPLILANVRFLLAGTLMLTFGYTFANSEKTLPRGREWGQLAIFALFNTTLYLSAFVLSMREVSAGIGSLSTATGPLFVIVLSAIWLQRRLKWNEALGVVLGLSGAGLATWPLLQNSFATPRGLSILMAGIVSVSAASVYYARISWRLPNVLINGWQVMMGGIMLLPFTIYFADWQHTRWDAQFWGAVGWLIVPVSVISLQLWFYLLRLDAVRASMWLFLCPVFGFTYSSFFLGEPLSWHTFVGTALVVAGLYVAQRIGARAKGFSKPAFDAEKGERI
ncbi:DMT family transporter [Runella sp. SP2]|uniref:DMT family transporter n=1 Tax=Runella sp. SP2 TaxID=2268026 RepID=UPI000F08767C|nr:EamA family transporter [Runella sp. SP2]AYQ35835.1 EamA family transporter [Runella sp. SP2]